MEVKSSNILQRLRQLQVEQCCLHMDEQIRLWYQNLTATETETEIEPEPETETTTTTPAAPATPIRPNPTSTPSDGDERTVGCFLSNIKHLESFESDATESTSSDDSYDELEGFSLEDIPPKRSNGNQDLRHSKNKAIWKWANERSRLAARWTWLQAQIADLEFRIRGQNDALMHARAYKTPPLHPVPENSCSRTVPISKDFRRRRLIRSSRILSDSNKKLVKFSHVPCVCSSLPQTVAPCLSCNGRYNYLRQIEGENAPISERISLLDPCCHPVLSFPDDITLGSQLSYLLKQETINRKPTKGRPGRKKGSTAANLAAARNATNNTEKKGNKYHHGIVGRTSQAVFKLRRKYRNNWRNKPLRRASAISENPELNNQHTRPKRRRSEQSAYDIDNIVIPFSIAATTRVEVLEYKEIMTPSWRVWENGTTQESIDPGTIDEDTSDEAYITRHSKGESDEKKRFSLKPRADT